MPKLKKFNSPPRSHSKDVELESLKVESQTWDIEQWENYLQKLDVSGRERLCSFDEFESLTEQVLASEFSAKTQQRVISWKMSELLCELTPRQRDVIEKIFFKNMSERQVAGMLMISRQGVVDLKIRALRRLNKLAAKLLADPSISKGRVVLDDEATIPKIEMKPNIQGGDQ